MIILVGMIAGAVVDMVSAPNEENIADDVAASLLSFSPTAFFVVLLPPVSYISCRQNMIVEDTQKLTIPATPSKTIY